MSARFRGYLALCGAVAVILGACGVYGVLVLAILLVLLLALPDIRLQVLSLWYMVLARPRRIDRSIPLELDHRVEVRFSKYGIPLIEAQSRLDAARVLGFVIARERMFQLEWLRRRAAGRLSELLGPSGLSVDLEMRRTGLSRTASRITRALARDQYQLLEAFSHGVNAFIDHGPPPFEFRVLRHNPEHWTPTDSILILQGMFHQLHGDISSHRMSWIMEKCLPKPIVDFLLSKVGSQSIPIDELGRLFCDQQGAAQHSVLPQFVLGSNACAVAGSRTHEGRSIVANDLHLPLTIPSLFFAVHLRYEDVDVSGVVLPGVPAVLAGSSRHLAWGVTNLPGGCLDLVPVERGGPDGRCYRHRNHWVSTETVDEVIRVRGGSEVVERVEWTAFGPIVEHDVLEHDLALQWSALLPSAVDLGLERLHGAKTLDQAIDILRSAGCPPLNVLLSDTNGTVARTVTGRFPRRRKNQGWDDWIRPQELPCAVEPPEGYYASANEANPLAFNPSPHHRMERLVDRLKRDHHTPISLFAMQLDLESPCLAKFRELALLAVPCGDTAHKAALRDWDGRATLDCVVLAWLYTFRARLASAIFSPMLGPCRRAVPNFQFLWNDVDTPLFSMLELRPSVVPGPYGGWDELIAVQLQSAADDVSRQYGRVLVPWKEVNRLRVRHPLWSALPLLRPLLAWPSVAIPGGPTHLWSSSPEFGSAARIVAVPGTPDENILQIPGGQSGHIPSAHFMDQFRSWRYGRAVRGDVGVRYTLSFFPGQ